MESSMRPLSRLPTLSWALRITVVWYSEVIHSRYVAETAGSVVSEHGIDSSSVGVMWGFGIGLVCSCLVTSILPIWRSEFVVVALFHRQEWRFYSTLHKPLIWYGLFTSHEKASRKTCFMSFYYLHNIKKVTVENTYVCSLFNRA